MNWHSYELEDPGSIKSILEKKAAREEEKRKRGDYLPRYNAMTASLKISKPVSRSLPHAHLELKVAVLLTVTPSMD